jgi:uncharacterized protein
MTLDLAPILRIILQGYTLPLNGDHGVLHWARVYEIGQRLAAETGARPDVVALFAILHDSKRVNEHSDPEHGPRAAEFAVELRGSLLELDDHSFNLLQRACQGHTHERTHPDTTIQTCWDSDRLDLGRVGIRPHPEYLSTEIAKSAKMIAWANKRAVSGYVARATLKEWEYDPGEWIR